MSLEIGRTYDDRYKILRPIAEGGEGTVFLAQDEKLRNHLVAIKACTITRIEDRADFEKEALILIDSSHANMPKVYNIFETPENELCLVMDYIEGENLEQLRSKGELNEGMVVHWLSQICDTLQYLHNETIFHGDIKPRNIIISAKDPHRAFLVDFGSAKVYQSKEENGYKALHFSPGYTSPEQYQGRLDARSDIYALGATLYTLLSGKIYNPQFTIKLSGQASKFFTVVSKSLMLSPGERFQTAAQFKVALSGAQYEETVPEKGSELLSDKSPAALPRWAWLAGAGLLLVACLLGAYYILSSIIPPTPTAASPLVLETTSAPAAFSTDEGLLPATAVDTQASLPATILPGPTTGLPAEQIDPQGVAMALIPDGGFQMGSDVDDSLAECQKFRSDCQRDWFTNEEPVHDVYLDAFYIDLHEVTNALYADCVGAGVCSQPRDTDRYLNSSYLQHPVVYVDWNQARQYCQWRGGDLPTEAQWEKAARGGLQGMLYPWGDETPVCTDGAENGAQFSDCGGQTLEVGSFSPNGYGLYDMAGNVWEWVLDWYLDAFYSSSPPENPFGPTSGTSRVLRGGSWNYVEGDLRVANRSGFDPHDSDDGYGFRCSRLP